MGTLSFLMMRLVDSYRDEGVFTWNKNEVKMGLKDVAIISS